MKGPVHTRWHIRGAVLSRVGPDTIPLPRAAARGARLAARGGQCLKGSLTFAPACLVSPLTWSPRPSARRRRLPVTRPADFLALPFTASALCAIFLAILMAG